MSVFRRTSENDNSDAQRPTPPTIRARAVDAQISEVSPVTRGPLSIFVEPAQSAPYSAPRVLTAAAAQVRVNDRAEYELFRQRRNSASSAWQIEAWEYYDAIGEIKYAFNLVASVISRIRLYPAVIDNPSEAPKPVQNVSSVDPALGLAAERAIQRLDSAYGGQAGLLRDAALNLSVTGECYLVQMPARPGSGIPESWDIKSTDEVVAASNKAGSYTVLSRREQMGGSQGGKGGYELPNKAFIGRIWRAHPRFSDEADSSLRGMLDLCAELLLLNRTFRATARSRLNAGALYLPDGLSVAASGDPDLLDDDMLNPGAVASEAEDEFEDQLIDAMTTPIRDEDSASAVVPLIIRGPAELGDKIKQFKFERSFDPALAERADRVLERILQGIDIPKDVVTGLANVKYSNALQIDEALYKAHIEPLMLLIVDALTVVYFRPYLIANGYSPSDVDRMVIWYDPSAVSTRNDRAEDADMGYDRHVISGEAWRRAHGFSNADAPTDAELAVRLLVEKGQITPELTEAMLAVVSPTMMDAVRAKSMGTEQAALPEEVQNILNMAKSAAAPATETPAAPETPTQETKEPQETVPPEPAQTPAPNPGPLPEM